MAKSSASARAAGALANKSARARINEMRHSQVRTVLLAFLLPGRSPEGHLLLRCRSGSPARPGALHRPLQGVRETGLEIQYADPLRADKDARCPRHERRDLVQPGLPLLVAEHPAGRRRVLRRD